MCPRGRSHPGQQHLESGEVNKRNQLGSWFGNCTADRGEEVSFRRCNSQSWSFPKKKATNAYQFPIRRPTSRKLLRSRRRPPQDSFPMKPRVSQSADMTPCSIPLWIILAKCPLPSVPILVTQSLPNSSRAVILVSMGKKDSTAHFSPPGISDGPFRAP
jgi:hypothetical protein